MPSLSDRVCVNLNLSRGELCRLQEVLAADIKGTEKTVEEFPDYALAQELLQEDRDLLEKLNRQH